MHKVILSYSILACIVCNAQNITNGTELADNLTSRSRIVVDAFENASNRVHALIQEVSPSPDLSGYATTGAVAAVNNITTSLDATKRGLTDLAVYGYAPWYLENYWRMDWNGTLWEGQDGADSFSLEWSNGAWLMNFNGGYHTPIPSNDFNAAIMTLPTFYNYSLTRQGIYITNGAHLVTSADAMPYLATTGGVVTGNIILPQTGGSGGKTTINGNGITAGIEGFTIDSFSDPLVLKGSSATINFSDTRFIRGWDAVSDGNGNSIARLFNSTNDFVRKSDFGQTITNVAEGVTGDATNALAVALGDSIESVRQTASNANNNVDYLEQFTIPAWRAADLLTATNFTKAYIATNNPAFVAAVTNCPVAIAAGDAEALTQWGIYGGGGTIGALLAALAAAVAALKKKKMPLYPVGGTGNPVNATYESRVLTISPFSMAAYTPTANAAFSVEMGALPSDLETGKARDAVLVIDCSLLTEGQEPRVTWDTHFHPRTDTATDLAIVEAGKRAVFYISEYASGEFAVGGWVETAGGSGT